MTSQAGFTLVEALTTGAIAAIVGTAILSVLYMSNSHIQEGSANLRLVQLQSIASDQVRASARLAYGVKSDDAPGSFSLLPPAPANVTGLKEIYFCDSAGNVQSAYRVNPAQPFLEERRMVSGTMEWTPFRVGAVALEINPDESHFTILARRRGIVFSIRYRLTQGGKTYTLPLIPERVICRSTDQ